MQRVQSHSITEGLAAIGFWRKKIFFLVNYKLYWCTVCPIGANDETCQNKLYHRKYCSNRGDRSAASLPCKQIMTEKPTIWHTKPSPSLYSLPIYSSLNAFVQISIHIPSHHILISWGYSDKNLLTNHHIYENHAWWGKKYSKEQ